MAFVLKDRVKEITSTTGTGDVSLSGAASTFDAFSSYLSNGDTTYYALVHKSSGVDEWEVGLGTWNTGNTFSRTTILAGSNGTSAVNFSAGTKDIFMTYIASKAVYLDSSNNLSTTTDNITEGSTNRYYSDSLVDSHLSGGTGVTYSSGAISIGQAVNTNSNVTFNNITVDGTLSTDDLTASTVTTSGNVVITGDLTVNGTTTTVNSTTTTVDDPVFTLGGDSAPSSDDNKDRGIEFRWHNGTTAKVGFFGFDDSTGKFTFIPDATNTSEVFSGSSGTIVADLEGNSTTATTLETARTIGGVSFNGSANIDLAGVNTAGNQDTSGNAATATALETARNIQLSGDVTGTASFDGSANINITTAVQDDSHAHVISNVDGLQTALDAKVPTSRTLTAGNGLTGGGDLSANRTFTVGAGTGITVNADDIAIDSSYTGFDSRYYTEGEADARFLLDSEVTNLAQVKAFDSSDYATAAQGSTADAALARSGGTMTGAITFAAGQSFDGRDVSADGSKLDGIESGATGDQTNAEIRAAVEAATDSNVFTDADHTKLNGIEASADVTDATNVTAAGALMDSEVTNLAQVKAFDSSDYATAAQGTTADNALPKSGGAMTGAITTNSTFDGRDVATDGTKLDGIEANATADQTASEIRALVESATDSNVFTDADHTKLNGIEASADVTDTTNVTAAGALMDSELTDIASVKALNQGVATTDSPTFAALTVDGHILQDSTDRSGLLSLDTTLGTWRGIQIEPTTTSKWSLMGNQTDFGLYDDENGEWILNYNENSTLQLYSNGTNSFTVETTGATVTGNLSVTGTVDGRDVATDGTKLDGIESGATADQTAAEILTAIKTVDGSGSGLDADTVDGFHAYYSQILDNRGAGDVTPDNLTDKSVFYAFTDDIASSPNSWDSVINVKGWTDSYRAWQLISNSSASGSDNDNLFFRSGISGTWGSLRTVWDSGNDGSGSGLDADTVDGIEASQFLRSDVSDSSTGTLTLDIVQVGNELRLPNNTSLTDVSLTGTSDQDTGFNWSGSNAVNYVSGGTLKYNLNDVWASTNDGSGSGLDADTVDGIEASSFLRSDADDSTSNTITFSNDIVVGDQIIHNGDTDTYMQFHNANEWRVVTGGTERLEVTNSALTSAVNMEAPLLHSTGGTFASGTDTNTNAALVLESGDQILGHEGTNYLRNLLKWTSGSTIDIGQGGTSLISGITLEAGTSGVVTMKSGLKLDHEVTETVTALSGTSDVLEPQEGTIRTHTLSGNTTYTESFSAGQSMTLMIDDGAGYTVTWPTMTWVNNGGSAPTLATSGYTVIVLWKVSTTLYGALVGDGS